MARPGCLPSIGRDYRPAPSRDHRATDRGGVGRYGPDVTHPIRLRTPLGRLGVLVAAAILATGVGVAAVPAPVGAWDAGSFSAAAEADLLQLTNQARASAGLRALTLDSVLVSTARWRSKDMIARDYFSHDIPGSGSVFDVLQDKGYCFKVAGENIGWNTSADETAAQDVHSMFMGSAGHRSNIMGRTWDVIGIGAYQGDDRASGCSRSSSPTVRRHGHPDTQADAEATPSRRQHRRHSRRPPRRHSRRRRRSRPPGRPPSRLPNRRRSRRLDPPPRLSQPPGRPPRPRRRRRRRPALARVDPRPDAACHARPDASPAAATGSEPGDDAPAASAPAPTATTAGRATATRTAADPGTARRTAPADRAAASRLRVSRTGSTTRPASRLPAPGFLDGLGGTILTSSSAREAAASPAVVRDPNRRYTRPAVARARTAPT